MLGCKFSGSRSISNERLFRVRSILNLPRSLVRKVLRLFPERTRPYFKYIISGGRACASEVSELFKSMLGEGSFWKW